MCQGEQKENRRPFCYNCGKKGHCAYVSVDTKCMKDLSDNVCNVSSYVHEHQAVNDLIIGKLQMLPLCADDGSQMMFLCADDGSQLMPPVHMTCHK